jgi:NADH-quinone oxidoreductase subunit H
LGIIFFISILAETNRLPFDLPEAEAELVAGYNVEYSAFAFAAFFLGEYSNILIMSALFIVLFFGGGGFFSLSLFQSTFLTTVLHDFVFGFKISVIAFMFVFIRANLPRFRFDQLMFIGWKIFLPLTLSLIFFYPCFFFFLGALDITQIPRLGIEFNYILSMSTRV